MRLIDADECPCFKCARNSNRPCPMWLCDSWCSWLQKTAYDVDKVISELENVAYCKNIPTYDNPYTGGLVIDEDEAINIVKRGGIE